MTNQHPPHVSGTIRELVWVDDSDSPCTRAYAPAIGGRMIVVELDPGSGEYSAGIDLSGLCFRLIQSTYDDGYGIKYSAPAKFPSIDAAKAAAQADYEARILAAIQPDPEPQLVVWPEGFFILPAGGDTRLRECSTEGCYQHCSIRVEHGGIGSDYCEPCARKIATPSSAGTVSVEAVESLKPFFGDPVMEGLLWSDATPEILVTIRVQKRIYDRARTALRALSEENK